MKGQSIIAWTVVLLALLVCHLGSQQTGEIRGRVAEESGEALLGVSITATSPSLQGSRTALSDKVGKFRLPLLPVGTYTLIFELSGFEKLIVVGQDIHLGFTVDTPVTMKPAGISAEVTVKAPAPLIDKTKADTSYRLNSDELSRIPIQARTITEVVGLTPGVTGVRVNTLNGGSNFGATPHAGYSGETGDPSFRGEGDLGNNWLIDGLSSKGAAANVPGIRVNYDAWEEVQIISDGFSPEMSQGLGGFINIVTKSGGNSLHGELGAMIRDRRLRASRQEQLSAATVPQTSLNQFFGNLGGPVIKDKLWFFLSNDFFSTLDKTSAQSVGWLSIPAGNRQISTNNVLGKITFTPAKNHTLALSGTSDNFLGQSGGIGVPETYTKWVNNIFYYRLSYQGILSQDTLLTAALGRNRRLNSSRPLNEDYGLPPYYWHDIALATNNAEFSWSAIDRRTDLAASLTHYFGLKGWGSHELKVGLSYYENLYDVDWPSTGADFDPWPENGFDDGAEIFWATFGIPIQLMEKARNHPKNSTRGFGAHIQDSFTSGHFSLMLGLRTDTQRVFNDLKEPGWRWGFGDFLQPRVSLSFNPDGEGKNVIKFGYGRFALPISCLDLQGMVNKTIPGFRLYEWLGSENPTDLQLSDPDNWIFFFEQSTTATPRELDPKLKPNKMDKTLLEFDHQIGPYWALKVRGIFSRSKNLIEDIGIYDPEVSGGVRFQFTNFELKRRNYKALEIELNGKIAEKLMVNASYTWSGAKGTNTGNNFELYQWDQGWGDTYGWSFFGDHALVPNDAPEKEYIDTIYHGFGGRGIGDEDWYGYLPYSVDHIFKILGSYLGPWGLAFSSNIEFLSGYHWEKKGLSDVGMYALFPEGRGGRTTPAHLYVDMAAEKDFRMKNGMSIIVGLNVYNLLNSQRPVAYAKQDNELFGQVWARQLPRWVQIKFSLKF